jgi:hypothetical protein
VKVFTGKELFKKVEPLVYRGFFYSVPGAMLTGDNRLFVPF